MIGGLLHRGVQRCRGILDGSGRILGTAGEALEVVQRLLGRIGALVQVLRQRFQGRALRRAGRKPLGRRAQGISGRPALGHGGPPLGDGGLDAALSLADGTCQLSSGVVGLRGRRSGRP